MRSALGTISLHGEVFGGLLDELVLVVEIFRGENVLRIGLLDEEVAADDLLLRRCDGGCHPCSSTFSDCCALGVTRRAD